ncbi:ribosomal RNA small subunit methyltransferase E [Weizmannia acidilactici]|uniref:Ribosomal RNA small subunit methyltransferase E n=1 Tax=Weizmannia acidilactici TaxID=2607726 RepID=A0A5J4JCV2_9BACI|nr:16S rRNA (uracil(1498)-N(3))-methyltransferase [Weizmannia acidilactici]GER69601.1 ribosomal RNA small subunit methyltransferase E [Weizmannia acidilactici]GER72722.1 ribosomal RNA small subunit methyltransferase E [Weizmannia acidilactici]
MQRYFLKQFYHGEQEVRLQGEVYHHIAHVMRMSEGSRFYCVFLDEKACICEIKKITSDTVIARIVGWENAQKELPVHITVASGLPKADKLEWVIQKGTELGADQFLPFIAERSVVKWDAKKEAKKRERWKKIALEAAEQSHRNHLPDVSSPVSFKKLLEESRTYKHKLVAFEESAKLGERRRFAEALSKMAEGDNVLMVFGPEGGLSPGEVRLLEESGFETCGLGPRILRAETAPLYALAAISYHFELMR